MPGLLPKISRITSRFVRDPRTALSEARLRLFAFSILARDPEAYQYVASWAYGRAQRATLQDLFPGIEDVDVDVSRAFDRDVVTSVTAKELMALAAIVRLRRPQRILEIGTFNGNTTLNFAANTDASTRITTVDLPEDFHGDTAIPIREDRINVTDRAAVGRQFRGAANSSKINQVFGDSASLDWNELGGPFDVIFIDGCHEYAYVRSDTDSALRHVAEGGLIIWHDYGNFAGVSQAVDETSEGLRVCAIRGTRLAVGFHPRIPAQNH